MSAFDELPGKVNYLVGGNAGHWRTGIATFGRVKHEAVYPGIDLIFYGNQRKLEFDFLIAPGVDPRKIRIQFGGAEKIELNASGDLVFHTASGDVVQHAPVVYQEVNGARKDIPGHYRFHPAGDQPSAIGNPTVGFEVAAYDTARPLVIDPVLSYSTFLGSGAAGLGIDDGGGKGIAVDAAGNAYVTGSATIPTTPGSFDSATPSGVVAFVTKFNAAGNVLVYSTYIGGDTGGVIAYAIAVNAAGNAFITGLARSDDFPTRNPFQATRASRDGCFDAFVTKLNPSGSDLIFSTYLGGAGDDVAYGVAVDKSGNVYLAGETASANFPVTHPLQATLGGGLDAFVAKINPAGSARLYSTYLGGANGGEGATDSANAIAVDAEGNAYVTGITASSDFPTRGAYQANNLNSSAVFVTRISEAANASPAVAIISPSDGATLTRGQDVNVVATASDPDGSITRIELFVNDVKEAEGASSPFNLTLSGLAVGAYILYAKATDNAGGTAVSVAVRITVGGNPPQIRITSPADNAIYFICSRIGIGVDATPTDNVITNVALFYGSTKIAESRLFPLSVPWTNIFLGTNTFIARATDDQGLVGSSSPVNIIVTGPPINHLVAVLSGATNRNFEVCFNGVSGRSYAIEATTNFLNWVTLTNVMATNRIIQFVDLEVTNFVRRYYRARQN